MMHGKGCSRLALLALLLAAFSLAVHCEQLREQHPTPARDTSERGKLSTAGRADSHPFQTWLHGWLEGVGRKISVRHGSRGVARPYASLRSGPVLSFSEKHEEDGEQGAKGNDSDGEMRPIDISSSIYMDEGEFDRGSQVWMQRHRDTLQADIMIIFLGAFIFLVATGVLLYSEVSLVMKQRKADDSIIANADSDIPGEVLDKLRAETARRAWLSPAAVAGMVVGLWIGLFSLCHMATEMLASMHYELRGVYELAFLVSFVVAAIWSLFIVGCCWVCTRPWTALLCISIAFLGYLAVESGSAADVVMWVFMSVLWAWVFFAYGHLFFTDGPKRRSARSPLLGKEERGFC